MKLITMVIIKSKNRNDHAVSAQSNNTAISSCKSFDGNKVPAVNLAGWAESNGHE